MIEDHNYNKNFPESEKMLFRKINLISLSYNLSINTVSSSVFLMFKTINNLLKKQEVNRS